MAGFTTTRNDSYVHLLVEDPNYKIQADGIIHTQICSTGKKSKNCIWRILVAKQSSSGHLWVKYKYKRLAVHRVIFRKFHGSLSPHLVVNHKDGNKMNNTPENLELITQSENMLHCFRVLKRIPLKPRQKISQEIAEEIRRKYVSGKSNRELREEYRLSKASISYIVNGKTWKTAALKPHLHKRF